MPNFPQEYIVMPDNKNHTKQDHSKKDGNSISLTSDPKRADNILPQVPITDMEVDRLVKRLQNTHSELVTYLGSLLAQEMMNDLDAKIKRKSIDSFFYLINRGKPGSVGNDALQEQYESSTAENMKDPVEKLLKELCQQSNTDKQRTLLHNFAQSIDIQYFSENTKILYTVLGKHRHPIRAAMKGLLRVIAEIILLAPRLFLTAGHSVCATVYNNMTPAYRSYMYTNNPFKTVSLQKTQDFVGAVKEIKKRMKIAPAG